jgi:hypothetical protein
VQQDVALQKQFNWKINYQHKGCFLFLTWA